MNRDDLIDLLNKNSIRFKLTEHKPLFTVEDSKNLRGQIDGAHSKNLFLKDKKDHKILGKLSRIPNRLTIRFRKQNQLNP